MEEEIADSGDTMETSSPPSSPPASYLSSNGAMTIDNLSSSSLAADDDWPDPRYSPRSPPGDDAPPPHLSVPQLQSAAAATAAIGSQPKSGLRGGIPKRKGLGQVDIKSMPSYERPQEFAHYAPSAPSSSSSSQSFFSSNNNNSRPDVVDDGPIPSPSSTLHYLLRNQIVESIPPDSPLEDSLRRKFLSYIYPDSNGRFPPHQLRALPGPLPASLTRHHLALLSKQDYWVAEKSDGERAMMWCEPANEDQSEAATAYFIDRSLRFYRIVSSLYSELYAAYGVSIFDGELVTPIHRETLERQRPYYVIFDLFKLAGSNWYDQYLETRLKAIGEHVSVPFTERISGDDGADAPILIRGKAMYKKKDLQKMILNTIMPISKISKLAQQVKDAHVYVYSDPSPKRPFFSGNDGIIFTPEEDDYFCKTLPILKWKWSTHNTIDFKVINPFFDNQDRLLLYSLATIEGGRGGDMTGDILIRRVILHPDPERARREKARLLNLFGNADFIIAECAYEPSLSTWSVRGIRSDKNSANFITTVISTMEAVIDNITPDDLLKAVLKQIKPAPNPTHPSASSSHQPQPKTYSAPAPPPSAPSRNRPAPPSSYPYQPPPSSSHHYSAPSSYPNTDGGNSPVYDDSVPAAPY